MFFIFNHYGPGPTPWSFTRPSPFTLYRSVSPCPNLVRVNRSHRLPPRRRPPRRRKMASYAVTPSSSSVLFASSFLLLVVVSSAYRPGDIVPMSRMGQYHSVRDLSTPSFLLDRFRLRLLIFPVLDFCLIGWVDGFSVQDCLARCGRPPLPDVCC